MWGELEATCGIRKLFYADVVVSPSVQLKRGKNALNPLTEATKLGRTRQQELGGRIHRWAAELLLSSSHISTFSFSLWSSES